MKKIWIPIICGVLLSLIGLIYAETKEEIAAKADNKTIMVYIQQQQEQRKEDREDRKTEQKQQQEINSQILQSIQMMLIHQVTEDK